MNDGGTRHQRFDEYLDQLTEVIGHASRCEQLRKYCTGLVLPGFRKSVEPIAARLSPGRVSAEHQSLLHFVGNSPWKDEAVLGVARQWALPQIERHGPIAAWIIDDSGIPKKGEHSVGVANQYCGVLGKNHNCQVAVTVSVANEEASLPAAHQLYLPKKWANSEALRWKAGVPDDVRFLRKWEIALGLVDSLLQRASDLPVAPVLADPGYGDCFAFRHGLTVRDLRYMVGVSPTVKSWPPGQGPLPPGPYKGRGQRPKNLRRDEDHQPVTGLELARSLSPDSWQEVTWREGTDGDKTSRFAALRVRPSRRDWKRTEPHPTEWLLIEWPEHQDAPTKYWLSSEPPDACLEDLVKLAKLRWRIERDYQDLKQEVGFGHYEGRGWRGFHHHTTLCIAAYAFLLAERARLSPPDPRAEPPVEVPALPDGFRPRGAPDPGRAAPADVREDHAPGTGA